MFNIQSAPVDEVITDQSFVGEVSKIMPHICAELKLMLREDNGGLFANNISFGHKSIESLMAIGFDYTVMIGNRFIKSSDVFSTVLSNQKIRHDWKQLECSLSIAVKRSLGIYVGDIDEPFDRIVIRVTVFDEFVSAIPQVLGNKSGFAKLHSWSANLDEGKTFQLLKHIRCLEGVFTPQSLIEDIKEFSINL